MCSLSGAIILLFPRRSVLFSGIFTCHRVVSKRNGLIGYGHLKQDTGRRTRVTTKALGQGAGCHIEAKTFSRVRDVVLKLRKCSGQVHARECVTRGRICAKIHPCEIRVWEYTTTLQSPLPSESRLLPFPSGNDPFHRVVFTSLGYRILCPRMVAAYG